MGDRTHPPQETFLASVNSSPCSSTTKSEGSIEQVIWPTPSSWDQPQDALGGVLPTMPGTGHTAAITADAHRGRPVTPLRADQTPDAPLSTLHSSSSAFSAAESLHPSHSGGGGCSDATIPTLQVKETDPQRMKSLAQDFPTG